VGTSDYLTRAMVAKDDFVDVLSIFDAKLWLVREGSRLGQSKIGGLYTAQQIAIIGYTDIMA
jgi:hypothetical protein